MKPTPTLDEWVEEKCPELRKAIKTHIKVFMPTEPEDEQDSLVRLIMISVRQEWPRR